MKTNSKEALLEKYPDRKDSIEKAFGEIAKDDGCSGCQKSAKLRALLIELGEIKPIRVNDSPTFSITGGPHLTNAGAPRPQCEECYKEHIAKAIIQLGESKLGHPTHRWLAIGNLAEASTEIVGIDPVRAMRLREVKLKMIYEKDFIPDLTMWLKEDVKTEDQKSLS